MSFIGSLFVFRAFSSHFQMVCIYFLPITLDEESAKDKSMCESVKDIEAHLHKLGVRFLKSRIPISEDSYMSHDPSHLSRVGITKLCADLQAEVIDNHPGEKIALIGDSILANNSSHPFCHSVAAWLEYDNSSLVSSFATGGTGFVKKENYPSNESGNPFCVQLESARDFDPDIILVVGGVNDLYSCYPKGQILEAVSTFVNDASGLRKRRKVHL